MSQLKQSTRQAVFDRRGHECAFCAITGEQHVEEYGQDLAVHHIIPSKKGGSDDPDNLIPVCIGCHQKIEEYQGRALGRIAEQEHHVEKIEELEQEIEELRKRLAQEQENTINVLRGVDALVELDIQHKVYVVHETRVTTSRLLYVGTSIDDAEDAFENAEYDATMERASVRARDWVCGLSEGDLEIIESRSNDSAVLSDRLRDVKRDKDDE